MATKKVKVPSSWKAKPVTKVGGGSGGVRDPKKPYVEKPKNTKAERPARWDAKTKIEQLKEAAKTKPKSPAPRATATPKPAAKPTAKPNSKASAPPSNNRPGARPTMPNSSRAGINLPRAAVNALPKPIGPTTKGMTLASVSTAAAKATVKGVASKALMVPAIAAQIADIKGGFDKLANHPLITKMGKGGTSKEDKRSNRPGGGSKPKKAPIDNEKLFRTGGSRDNYGLDKKPETVAPLPASVRKLNSSSSSSSTASRGGVQRSGSSSSSSSTSSSGTSSKSGQKFEDFNPGRGTSKTNNPLMKDMIKRMKDREDKEQASKAKQLTDKSRQNSGYSSAEKVDGSKYADELKKKKGYSFSTQ